jgi:Protein of unknown function (DUF2490)
VRLIVSLVFAVLTSVPGNAQTSEVGNWIIHIGNQGFSTRWNWHNEVQYRNYDLGGDLQQLLLRTGIGYDLSEKNNNVLLGYAFVHSRNYVGDEDDIVRTDEHRLFQQFITRQTFGRTLLTHRYRFEERNWDKEWRYRLRYLLWVHVPLNKPTMAEGAFYTSTYGELFLNTTLTVFDRYRLYGAFGYALNGWLRVELGYMRQGVGTGYRDQLQVAFFNNLRLDK